MTAKLSRKREQSSSNILFESVSSCVSPLSPGTPFPLRQRQEAKTYTKWTSSILVAPLAETSQPWGLDPSPAPWRCRKIKPYSRNSTNSRCGVCAKTSYQCRWGGVQRSPTAGQLLGLAVVVRSEDACVERSTAAPILGQDPICDSRLDMVGRVSMRTVASL